MKKWLFSVSIISIIGMGLWLWLYEREAKLVTNFEECAAEGNPIMESYPRQCRHENQTFTEYIGNELEKIDLIRIDHPRPNQIIESPLAIEGQAKGTWFFEGDFPIVLTDWDGLIIAEGFAVASDEWMTEEFVPFIATLEFIRPAFNSYGTLILRKDNPSGLTENDDALEIPIFFKKMGEGADNTKILPFKSGVTGKVFLGPVCPVMRDPPDPNCADKPYKSTVQIIAVGNTKSSPFAVVETDSEGNYKASLPPGTYRIYAIGGSPFPNCETKSVTVESDETIEANLLCDTGIR